MKKTIYISYIEKCAHRAQSHAHGATPSEAPSATGIKLGNFMKHDLFDKWSYPFIGTVPDRAPDGKLSARPQRSAARPKGAGAADRRREAALDEIAA